MTEDDRINSGLQIDTEQCNEGESKGEEKGAETVKIAVIGYSGSGKSVLAQKLGKKYACPVLYLDSIHFAPGWKERPDKEVIPEVTRFMRQPSWVIDGNYGKYCQEERLKRADRIIFMNFNRFSCLARCVKRYMMYQVQGGSAVRESMAEGCPEKLDWEFVWWILHKGRTGKKKRHYRVIAGKYPNKMVIIKNQKQLEAFEREEGLS